MSEATRSEVKDLHPDDANIMVEKSDAFEGISKVSRSIGEAFLKWPGFTIEPSIPHKFVLAEPFSQAALTASFHTRALTPKDRFIILGSHGFWDLLSVDTATEMINTNPRSGIARKLLKACLDAVKTKNGFKYEYLNKFGKGSRLQFYDDISVLVISLEHQLLGIKDDTIPEASHISFVDSQFKSIREMM